MVTVSTIKDFSYNHILNMPHHVSKTRPQMSRLNRAAQFAPFAALTGHDEAVKETARLTDAKLEIDEYTKEELNRRILYINENINLSPEVSITYFVPDSKKSGGAYVTETGVVSKIKEYENLIVMTSGLEIPIQEIILIKGTVFDSLCM